MTLSSELRLIVSMSCLMMPFCLLHHGDDDAAVVVLVMLSSICRRRSCCDLVLHPFLVAIFG
jgi:hypothetical protein